MIRHQARKVAVVIRDSAASRPVGLANAVERQGRFTIQFGQYFSEQRKLIFTQRSQT